MPSLRAKRSNLLTGTKAASSAPVILGPVPRILFQRVSNLVNKLALLLHKCRGRMLNYCCTFFKYPSPDTFVSPAPSRGEGLHRPWCDKILGTDCASRPSMTGARGANSFGRSMIEMLGVLAIIGVLSVGGIAGYSKAMEKFKINKAMDEYSHIIFGLLEHSSEIKRNNVQTDLVDLAQSLNLIPNNWQRQSARQVSDGLGNLIQLFFTPGNMYGASEARITFDFYLGGTRIQDKKEVSDAFSSSLCFALYRDFAQHLHPIIYESQLYRTGSSKNTTYYGDAYCGGKIPCLKDLSLAEMDKLCKTCSKGNEACSLSFTF